MGSKHHLRRAALPTRLSSARSSSRGSSASSGRGDDKDMMRAMYAAISGLQQHQLMLDVTANDIANVNTIGYKSSRVTFVDSLSQFVPRRGRHVERVDRVRRGADRTRRRARLRRRSHDRRRAPDDRQRSLRARVRGRGAGGRDPDPARCDRRGDRPERRCVLHRRVQRHPVTPFRLTLALFPTRRGWSGSAATGGQSANSGAPTVALPGEGSASETVAGTIEMSNVDLAQTFTNMIVAQRRVPGERARDHDRG
jgi:flagellar basal body rod protein FlgC